MAVGLTRLAVIIALGAALMGCSCGSSARSDARTKPIEATFSDSQYSDDLQAIVAPPPDWSVEVRADLARAHRVWISASGNTAYGVMRFSLPLPVGHEPVLWVFLREMKRSEGEADLIEKHWDPNLRAMRFVARGGLYTVRTSLFVRGFNGWAVYAGTLTNQPVQAAELALAERARELTLVGQAGRPDARQRAGR